MVTRLFKKRTDSSELRSLIKGLQKAGFNMRVPVGYQNQIEKNCGKGIYGKIRQALKQIRTISPISYQKLIFVLVFIEEDVRSAWLSDADSGRIIINLAHPTEDMTNSILRAVRVDQEIDLMTKQRSFS